jgi:hypothetical protein
LHFLVVLYFLLISRFRSGCFRCFLGGCFGHFVWVFLFSFEGSQWLCLKP